MSEATYRSLLALVSALREDPRALELAEAEATLSSNQEAKALSAEKDRKNEIFQEKCRFFGEDSKEAKTAYHELFEAKKALDSLPVSRAYQEAYNALHFTIVRIDEILFGAYRKALHQGGCHHD